MVLSCSWPVQLGTSFLQGYTPEYYVRTYFYTGLYSCLLLYRAIHLSTMYVLLYMFVQLCTTLQVYTTVYCVLLYKFVQLCTIVQVYATVYYARTSVQVCTAVYCFAYSRPVSWLPLITYTVVGGGVCM